MPPSHTTDASLAIREPTPKAAAPRGLRTSTLLSTQEVALLLRIDPSSVRRWQAERPPQGPPFIRLSERVVLYDTDDVQDWLDERRTVPGARRKAA